MASQPGSVNYYVNPDLEGMSSVQVLDMLIQEAGKRGIVVMLDMHSLEADGYMQDGLWYDDQYPESVVNQT